MIINGSPAGNVRFWASHLLRDDTNARAELVEMRGLLAPDLPRALREMQAIAAQSRSHGNFLYQANINPRTGEALTAAQWREAVDTLERNLGLSGHQRVIVEHEKAGRVHRHVVWNRVDPATLRVADMGGNYRIHAATARELEQRFGLEPTPARSSPDRQRAPELWELRAAERSGVDPVALKSELTALWQGADSGQAFAAALAGRGYILANGDRRDFCVVDRAGTAHSLARRLDGVKAKDVRARMVDIDRDSLPSVAKARAMQRARMEPPNLVTLAHPPQDRGFADRAREITRQELQPAKNGRQGGEGLYVTVSRKRLDYARPLVQANANVNQPPRRSRAWITGMGEFKAMAALSVAPVKSPRPAEFTKPVRPDAGRSAAEHVEAGGGEDGADGGLSALLAAIAAEVQGRTAVICDSIRRDFSGRIAATRRALPRAEAEAAAVLLRQMMKAALKAVRENAALEITGRQKAARVTWRRGQIRTTKGGHKRWDYVPER